MPTSRSYWPQALDAFDECLQPQDGEPRRCGCAVLLLVQRCKDPWRLANYASDGGRRYRSAVGRIRSGKIAGSLGAGLRKSGMSRKRIILGVVAGLSAFAFSINDLFLGGGVGPS